MEYMEQSLRSLFHVVRAMCHGIIMWNFQRILRRIYLSIIQSSMHIYIYIYLSIYLVVHEGILDWITSLFKDKCCWPILRLFSLDMLWSWMTSKDGLTFNDPHQLPFCPCVVCHCCFDLWWFDFDLMMIFFFRPCPKCWHMVQSRGSFIMSFRSLREVPRGFVWLVASFQWLGLSPINSGIPLLRSHISYIFSSDLCRPAPHLGVSVFSHPRLELGILFFLSFRFFFSF